MQSNALSWVRTQKAPRRERTLCDLRAHSGEPHLDLVQRAGLEECLGMIGPRQDDKPAGPCGVLPLARLVKPGQASTCDLLIQEMQHHDERKENRILQSRSAAAPLLLAQKASAAGDRAITAAIPGWRWAAPRAHPRPEGVTYKDKRRRRRIYIVPCGKESEHGLIGGADRRLETEVLRRIPMAGKID